MSANSNRVPVTVESSTAKEAASAPSEPSFWSRRYGRPLSLDEEREIRDYLVGFFRVLAEWDAAATEKANARNEAQEESPAPRVSGKLIAA